MPVSFNYIPGDIRVPLFYAEVDASAASVTVGVNQCVLIGQMLSGGTAEAGVPVRVATAAKAKTLFGRGSQLARMVEMFRANNPVGILFCVPLAEPAGSQAQGAITFAGEATASGVVYAYIGGTRVAASVAVGDTANAVANALAAVINGKADLPVEATVLEDSAEVTLTAKNVGAAGNDLKISINYNGSASGEELPEGIGAQVTAMTGGTGTPDVASAFTALGDEPFEFIGIPYADTNTLDLCAAEMQDATGRWSPTRQLYGHVYTALRGESGTLASFGSVRNDQHCTIFGYEPNAVDDVCNYVGALLGRTSVFITNDPARPTQTGVLIGLTAPHMQDRFTLAERQEMLTNGIATVYTQGNVRIERAVTTYQRNAFGDEDVSYLDSETLHTLAYILRYLRSIITTKYPRHKLANDGTRFGAGQAVVTPSIIRAELVSAYRALEDRAIVENADAFAENLVVERDASDVNRLNVLYPPDLVNQLRIFALLAQFRLQYTAVEE